jgi:spore coat protein H
MNLEGVFMRRTLLLVLALGLAACEEPLTTDSDDFADSDEVATDTNGDTVLDDSKIHTIDLELPASDWQAIIDEAAAYENNNADYPYAAASLTFDGTELAGDVGVRLKGHISIELTEGHSFPLKLDFNKYEEDLTLDGLKKLNLHTNFNGPPVPIMREFLSYEAWREFNVAASRTAFARVTMNGEDLGIYVMVEQVDGGFIKREFEGPYGDLYKPEQQSGGLEYHGTNINDYPEINHKWPDETDHSSLLAALEVLDSGSVHEVQEVFDAQGVLTYLAGNVVLGSWDSYPYTGHNYYLYEEIPGRFTMLPWDMNGSQEAEGLSLCSPMEGNLSGLLLREPELQNQYFDIASEFLEGPGSADWLDERLDKAQALLGSEISNEDIESLRMDIRHRTSRLEAELHSTGECH